MKDCCICPRNCHIDRESGNIGYCKKTAEISVARAALHFYEEPCISGNSGSGTVFFSGCNLSCVYCQNKTISQGNVGKNISIERLVEIYFELQNKGALNINLVTPSHYAPQIVKSLKIAKGKGLDLPVVWNSSGYEKVETLKMLQGLVDVFLVDFKYYNNDLAKRYSKATDYPNVTKKALAEMFGQQPHNIFDDNGIMQKGCLVRHLLLPNCLEDSKSVLKYLFNEYGHQIYISIMGQYTPCANLYQYPEINRKVLQSEYDELVDYAVDLGIENAFVQSLESADEFYIPDFDYEGI